MYVMVSFCVLLYKCDTNGHAYIVFCETFDHTFSNSQVWRIKFCMHSWPSKKKNQPCCFYLMLLTWAICLWNIALRAITIKVFMLLGTTQYISTVCGLSHSAVAVAAASRNTTCRLQFLWSYVKKEMLHIGDKVSLWNVQCSSMSKVFVKDM